MLSSLLLSPLMANAIRWPVISNIVVTPNGSGAWIYTFQTQFQDLAGIPPYSFRQTLPVMMALRIATKLPGKVTAFWQVRRRKRYITSMERLPEFSMVARRLGRKSVSRITLARAEMRMRHGTAFIYPAGWDRARLCPRSMHYVKSPLPN